MAMALLSKFKLNLQTLTAEVAELREKEAICSDQLQHQIQKGKDVEEDLRRKLMEKEAELSSCILNNKQLQSKVQFLEDENQLLQTNNKQLNQTINNILQAKQSFLKAYQDSTCEMKQSIQSKDTKIAMLSHKLNAHLSSLDSIRNQASSVNQVLADAQRVLHHKDELVARLKLQMDKVCEFESLLIEKNHDLEAKLKSNENEFHIKNRMIAELQSQLETAKIADQCPSKIHELQEALLIKEGIIQTLISENKALHSELGMLEVSFKIVQETMTRMDEEDRVAFSLILANQIKDATEKNREDDRFNLDIENGEVISHQEASGATVAETADSQGKEQAHIAIPLRENNNVHSCASESTFSPSSLVHSDSQPAGNASNVPPAEAKDNCNTCIQLPESECSTTQTGTS